MDLPTRCSTTCEAGRFSDVPPCPPDAVNVFGATPTISGATPAGGTRALRAAIVVPLAAAVEFRGGRLTPRRRFSPWSAAIALLIATDFPGSIADPRGLAYCGLAFNGAVLIAVGTWAAPYPWVAVPLCFVVGAWSAFSACSARSSPPGSGPR